MFSARPIQKKDRPVCHCYFFCHDSNAIGMTLEEAKQLGRKDVADALDGLPPQKMRCSNLAQSNPLSECRIGLPDKLIGL